MHQLVSKIKIKVAAKINIDEKNYAFKFLKRPVITHIHLLMNEVINGM